jgi:hypothetical protein
MIPPILPALPAAPSSPEARAPAPAGAAAMAAATVPVRAGDAGRPEAVEPAQAIESAARAAAQALFFGREVVVSGFHDTGSGRHVHRIADRFSGETLLQSPPAALLRFYASSRAQAAPRVAVEA